jgi:hypothetical protein
MKIDFSDRVLDALEDAPPAGAEGLLAGARQPTAGVSILRSSATATGWNK